MFSFLEEDDHHSSRTLATTTFLDTLHTTQQLTFERLNYT
jgi:hypothetical protein